MTRSTTPQLSTPVACGAPPRWARQHLPRQSGSLGRGPLGSSTVIGGFLCLGCLVRASHERGVGAHTAADIPGSLLRVAPYGVGKSHCPPGAAVAHPLSTLCSVPALDVRGMTVTHLSPAATCGPWDPRSPSGGTGSCSSPSPAWNKGVAALHSNARHSAASCRATQPASLCMLPFASPGWTQPLRPGICCQYVLSDAEDETAAGTPEGETLPCVLPSSAGTHSWTGLQG